MRPHGRASAAAFAASLLVCLVYLRSEAAVALHALAFLLCLPRSDCQCPETRLLFPLQFILWDASSISSRSTHDSWTLVQSTPKYLLHYVDTPRPPLSHHTRLSNMVPQAGVNGVLPVAVLQRNAPAQTPRGPKASQPRLKLVLRRLPPGLTKAEFEALVEAEWKVGAGKVDWFSYRKGKISKEYVAYNTLNHDTDIAQRSQTLQTIPRILPRH
jgi:hypothetical protein